MSDQERRDLNRDTEFSEDVEPVARDERPYCGRCGHPAVLHGPVVGESNFVRYAEPCSWPSCGCWNLKEDG